MTDLRLTSSNSIHGVRLHEYRINGSFRIPPHIHDNLKLGFLMHGAYAGDGDEGLEMAGPALVYYPSLTRAGAAFHNTAQHFLWADIDAGWLARMELCARLPVKPGVVANARMLKLAAALNASALGAGDTNPMELESAVYELLFALTDGDEDVSDRPRWWRDALNILHENENAIGLMQAAEALQLHPSHLARAFKAHAGCAIGEYSRRVRLFRSKPF